MKPILQVRKLSHRYWNAGTAIGVLQAVDLNVAAGKMVAVQGESGSGKTTLLLACGAMQKPTSGSVLINNQDVFSMTSGSRSRFRSDQIGYLFQTLELVPYLNLIDNLRVVKGVSVETARGWLERLGIGDRLNHKPDSLSHGQRQRAALARALVHGPALVIADEPTGNLDPKHGRLVFETLREFADGGGAVLIATHDPLIGEFADELHCLSAGGIEPRETAIT